uniref:Uncharacterized protein n=1 Tax=Kalanchoe fedtschenkoi TaxID=63787 RepID=A0A7N1A347_KALFE
MYAVSNGCICRRGVSVVIRVSIRSHHHCSSGVQQPKLQSPLLRHLFGSLELPHLTRIHLQDVSFEPGFIVRIWLRPRATSALVPISILKMSRGKGPQQCHSLVIGESQNGLESPSESHLVTIKRVHSCQISCCLTNVAAYGGVIEMENERAEEPLAR